MKSVNAICVKAKNEWFHVACSWYPLFHLVDFANLLSRKLLRTAMVTTMDNYYSKIVQFYIFVPSRTELIVFVELFKPEKLQVERSLFVVGIVSTTLLLTYKNKSKVFYLYYEELKLKLILKIDLNECLEKGIQVSWS